MTLINATYTPGSPKIPDGEKKSEKVTIVAVLMSSGESYPVIIFIDQHGDLCSSMHLGRFTKCSLKRVPTSI